MMFATSQQRALTKTALRVRPSRDGKCSTDIDNIVGGYDVTRPNRVTNVRDVWHGRYSGTQPLAFGRERVREGRPGWAGNAQWCTVSGPPRVGAKRSKDW